MSSGACLSGGLYMQALTVLVARNILTVVIRNAHFCSWTQVPVLAVVEWVQGGSLSSSQITSNVFKGSISEFAAAEEDALDAL